MPREAYLLVTESRFAGVNEILGPAPDDQLAVFWPQYPGQPFFWKSVVRLAMVSPARNGFHHGVSPAVWVRRCESGEVRGIVPRTSCHDRLLKQRVDDVSMMLRRREDPAGDPAGECCQQRHRVL